MKDVVGVIVSNRLAPVKFVKIFVDSSTNFIVYFLSLLVNFPDI